jgi:hypothetical protein
MLKADAFIAPGPAVLYLTWQQRHLAAAMGEPMQPEIDTRDESIDHGGYRLSEHDLALIHDRAHGGLMTVLQPDIEPGIVMAAADILARHDDLLSPRSHTALKRLFNDRSARIFLQANHFGETWYFNKERAEALLDWSVTTIPALAETAVKNARKVAENLKTMAAKAGYQQHKMLEFLTRSDPGGP